jgi:hypothetical protein
VVSCHHFCIYSVKSNQIYFVGWPLQWWLWYQWGSFTLDARNALNLVKYTCHALSFSSRSITKGWICSQQILLAAEIYPIHSSGPFQTLPAPSGKSVLTTEPRFPDGDILFSRFTALCFVTGDIFTKLYSYMIEYKRSKDLFIIIHQLQNKGLIRPSPRFRFTYSSMVQIICSNPPQWVDENRGTQNFRPNC